MKHCVKKLLSLAFALALCLAVGGIALAETPEQEVLAYEPNVTAEPGTNSIDKLATEGYQVTIPTTVTVDSTTAKGELMVKAQLKQYRTLNITMKPQDDKWTLKYQDAAADANTPQVGYTLKNEAGKGQTTQNMVWTYDESKHEINYVVTGVTSVDTANIPLTVNVTDPSQATMSGTYSDTLTFTFNLTKQSVTYTINVYHQEMALTNNHFNRADNAPKYQALKMVDKVGTDGAPIGDAKPDEVYTLEYGFANGAPVGSPPETWTRPRTGHSVPEDEDTRCWEDLTYDLNLQQNYNADNKDIVVNLNLVRKWCWLDVNGITNKDESGVPADGNQGGRIASFVNIKVSDGKNWSVWYWYTTGDDYWGTFPYGTEFQLGLHRVKDGYAYDTDDAGNVAIYANGNLEYKTNPPISENGTTYRVYQGKLEGEPVDETLHPTSGGGNVHDGAGGKALPRYCYNVCFVDGITYYANGGTGGREDTNIHHGPHTTFEYTAGMTLAEPLNDDSTGCKFTAPAGKVFAGWSTTPNYTAGQTLYAPGTLESEVVWPTPRPSTSHNDTLPNKDGQTVCRTLYAIWGYKTDIKIAFENEKGSTDKNAAGEFVTVQKGNFEREQTLKTNEIVIPGQKLTLKMSDPDVTAAINTATTAVGNGATKEKIWDLEKEYTITVPENSANMPRFEILRKRYLLNVMAVLSGGGVTVKPLANAEEAATYGTFHVKSNGSYQTAGGESKVSVYQWLRNYGGSYEVCEVEANPGYQFFGFVVPSTSGSPTTAGDSTHITDTLTGKNENLSYFGGDGKTYTGDTIYVVFKKDMVTYNFNGGTTQDGKTSTEEQYFPDSHIQKMSLRGPGTSGLQGWSVNQVEQPNETIYHADGIQLGNIPWPDPENKVLYARWSTGPNRAPAKKKVLTVHYHANFDPMEELALDLDPNPLLEDMDEDFGFDPDPLPEDILDPTVEAVKIVTYKPDENVVLRHCMFKRGGYVFVGWNTEPDGTGRNYEVNGVPITDWAAGATVDLYAQWKKPEHLKPVVDGEPQPGGTTPAPTPQPGGADAAPQPGGADDAVGIDPQLGGMDDAFGVDPQPEGLDDAFGVDPQLGGMDDAFGVDPQSGGMDDAFGV